MKTTCEAKTRAGTPCKRAPMANGRCSLHGGKTPGGIASPQFKTGKYSKYLPSRLLERYQVAAKDSDLLALREDIALIDARISDLLSRVDTGESGALWSEARKAFEDFRVANATKNADKMRTALMDLDSALERGITDYRAWNEVGQAIEQRRKLVESERKRLVEMQQMITSEQAMSLVAALTASVKEHVTDSATLSAIQAEFIRLASRSNSITTD